ncbi:MAG: surface lipoprotein assembly modifier [Rhodospirillaceae bacterium]|nr:surface lipoprotein assembly modifier [Rhodospirillaceae bacterium]MDE0256481.1 surface lipoprotein assembly modifier [Rhodospirillaceae bacterium]MDE0616044.1 surface lipoprotein assembly modifier [Rhodospirillaceae bacterium]
MRPLLAVLLALALLPAAVATASTDRPHLSVDPAVNRARTLIKAGSHEAALALLRPLAAAAAGRADRTDIRFLTGLAATRAAQRPGRPETDRDALLDEAIAAFRAILVERPGLARVRLELARAFFLKREDGLARDQFERVLAGRPSPAVAGNIRRFLNTMRARKRWSAHFGMALASDSNLNAASADDTIHLPIFGVTLPFRRAADAGPKAGLGVAVRGGAEYRWPLGDPVSGRLRLRLGGDFSRAEHGHSAFDRTTLSVHAGPHWLADADTELALLASLRRHYAAGEAHSREAGLRFEAGRRLSRRLTAQARASWHRRVHADAGSRALDGPVTTASLGIAWLATPQLRFDALAGWARERARSERYRNTRRRVRLGVSAALPWGFTLGGGAEWRSTDFDGRWFLLTLDNVPRRDRTRVLSASLFHRAFTLGGFSPRLTLVRETRRSNAQLHGYRRTRVDLGFVRQF